MPPPAFARRARRLRAAPPLRSATPSREGCNDDSLRASCPPLMSGWRPGGRWRQVASRHVVQRAAALAALGGLAMPITPTEKIWMNGQLVDWSDAKVHILTHTLHYGTGVFEGI